MSLEPLPIDAVLPDLLAALGKVPACVLRAPTGAGKTTRVPPALWDAQLSGGKQVVVLEPRRVAAQAAVRRMASERGVTLGDEIGYQVRFEKKAGRHTRILVVTEGLFLRMLQDDPFLERVGIVVFDEFHERSLDVDLALAMARKVQAEVRPDLKLLVMSATLEVGPLAAYLGGCPTIDSPGRQFAVDIRYLQHTPTVPLEEAAAEAIERLLAETTGDVLAFFPGVGEIRRAERALGGLSQRRDITLLALYGDLPLAEQQAVLEPAPRCKVVLATNVAETSLTIPGVTAVVDTGLARTLRLDPRVGLDRLDVVRISQASAEQRAGRAGRTAPGACQRLWLAREQAGLAARTEPEIQRVDLAGPVLQLLAWGEADLARFPWFEPPPAAALAQAQRLLQQLGAVADGKITELGQRMARFPAHPRIARLLCEAERLGHADRIALAGALLAERDPFVRGREGGRRGAGWSESDVLDRVAALEAYEAGGERGETALDRGAARFILRARDQWVRLIREDNPAAAAAREMDADEAVLRALVAAFPDRIARRREPRSPRAAMVGGRGVKLWERSAVRDPELFVCVEVEETGQSEALVRQASAVERAWIPAHRLRSTTDVEFDPARERVVAWRRTRCDDLVLDEAATSVPPDVDAGAVLAQAAAERLDLSTLLGEAEQSFLARAISLRGWRPELELPDLGEDPLRAMLAELCSGWLSFADVRKAGAMAALRNRFTPAQLAAIDREAPERLTAPSGSSIKLEYAVGKPPVLAVRIQEVFGWRETPRIANGRVRVLLHLLGPNYRPQQITDDLESFWTRTYPEVRKELRRRYPKHSWPEDPWTATPQRRPGKRS